MVNCFGIFLREEGNCFIVGENYLTTSPRVVETGNYIPVRPSIRDKLFFRFLAALKNQSQQTLGQMLSQLANTGVTLFSPEKLS